MNPNAVLTKTEWIVGEPLAWGATKKDVAKSRNKSIRTIENIVRSIFQKTEVTKINEFSAWYFCKKYDISFDLSPLSRSITSIALLLLITSYEYHNNKIVIIRSVRTERVRSEKRTDDDLTFDYQ